MGQGQIPSQFDRVQEVALKAIQPIRTADLQSYFYGKRTTAGRNLPPYYLVYFLLIELLKFPHLGKAEKVAWSIPLSFNDNIFVIEHRKLGLGVFVPESGDHEAAAAEIVRLVHRGVSAAEPFFEWIADEAVKSSELNVINRSESLFGRFEFLLEQHNSLSNEALARTGERQVEEKVSDDGKRTTTTVRFPEFELQLKAKWLALSVIEAFFSWTEHVFIHLAVLRGSIFTASEVSDLASAEWKTKFDRAVGAPTGVMATLFNQLLALRRELRNYLTHGAFGKEGQAFDFHSRAGAVPVLLPHRQQRYRFALSEDLTFDEKRALQTIRDFITELWSGEREPARLYIQESHGLPTILTLANKGRYKSAMRSVDDMNDLISELHYNFSRSMDMEW
jgi:hypothetical protein